MIGLFGIFGRSKDLQRLDAALRARGLHPRLLPEAAKLTVFKLLREATGQSSPPVAAHERAAELLVYCRLGTQGYAEENGLDPQEFVGQIYRNVPVLDTAARGSTTTFVQRGLGDVLLAWENEAYLALAELGEDQFDIIVPSVSVLAEPPIALVEGNLPDDATRALATAYLEQLYSPEAQAIALRHYYRAWDTSAAAAEDIARFPEVNRLTIEHFGGWAQVQPEHFGDGGIFDQIYDGQ